jgi:hypothetical protein
MFAPAIRESSTESARFGRSQADSAVENWIQLIRGEYLEVPSLTLTFEQIRRLWGLDEARCSRVLESLCETKFLRRTATGSYLRYSVSSRANTR